MQYFKPQKFRILAHRGQLFDATGAKFDENTLGSFAAAIEAGADYLELDIRASKDGKAMVFHDSSLKRVSSQTGRISDLNVGEVQALTLRHGGKIPTLEEVMSHFPSVRFNIDIKDARAADDLIATVIRLGAQRRILITSFSSRRRLRVTSQLPNVATSGSAATLLATWLRVVLGLKPKLAVSALQIPVRYGPIRFDSRRFITAIRNVGVEIHYWVINDPAEMTRLRNLGADGIVTDRTDLMVSALAE